MTDYWVSNAKHYCQLCRIWTQGDSESIRRHESGAGHKEREQQRLRDKRRATTAATTPEVLRQLAQIEAAAAASAKKSVSSGAFAGAVDARFRASQQQQRLANRRFHLSDAGEPGRRLTAKDKDGLYDGDATVDWYSQFDERSFSSRKEEPRAVPREEEEDEGGEYEVKGVRYLQGRKHAAKFVTNAKVEVWDAALEAWRAGTVSRVRRVFAGDENEARTYDVQLDDDERVASPAVENATRLERHFAAVLRREGRVLTEVAAEDLRVVADDWRPPPLAKPPRPQWLQDADRQAPVVIEEARQQQQQQRRNEPAPEVDANTGFGGWQTVAVREIDEVQEERERQAAEERREQQRRKQNGQKAADDRAARDLAKQLCDAEERRDARSTHLGAHDRTDVYKGITLARDDAAVAAPPAAPAEPAAAGSVAFKKRRTQNTSFRHQAAKKKKETSSSEDDPAPAAMAAAEDPPVASTHTVVAR